jgi:hypothetical protein
MKPKMSKVWFSALILSHQSQQKNNQTKKNEREYMRQLLYIFFYTKMLNLSSTTAIIQEATIGMEENTRIAIAMV